MTAVEWLIEQFEVSHSYINEIFKENIEQAKEMEKQQIIDAYKFGLSDEYVIGSDKYYISTYGSKGSDETNSEKPNETSSQTEISDKTWLSIDGRKLMANKPTEISDVSQGIALQNQLESKVITELSDEEIEEMLFHHSNEYAYGFKDAIQWYREQLKNKQ